MGGDFPFILFFFFRRRLKLGGLVFWFNALKWLSSGPGWCQGRAKTEVGSVCWEDGEEGESLALGSWIGLLCCIATVTII